MKMIRENNTPPGFSVDDLELTGASSYDEALFSLYAIRYTRPAPTDEFSDLPLPIFPAEYSNDWHHDQHHAFFPNVSPLLQGPAGRILRHSRLQYGNADLHSEYHYLYDGVQVPLDPKQRLATIVLACAGYVPETAIDVRYRKPVEVRLDAELRRHMQEDLIYPEARMSDTTGLDINNSQRGIFLMNCALNEDLDHIRSTLLEEFVETPDPKRRLKLGMFIVDRAFDRATEPVQDVYRIAHRRGYIHPAQRDDPVGLMRAIVLNHQPDYFRTLEERVLETLAA